MDNDTFQVPAELSVDAPEATDALASDAADEFEQPAATDENAAATDEKSESEPDVDWKSRAEKAERDRKAELGRRKQTEATIAELKKQVDELTGNVKASKSAEVERQSREEQAQTERALQQFISEETNRLVEEGMSQQAAHAYAARLGAMAKQVYEAQTQLEGLKKQNQSYQYDKERLEAAGAESARVKKLADKWGVEWRMSGYDLLDAFRNERKATPRSYSELANFADDLLSQRIEENKTNTTRAARKTANAERAANGVDRDVDGGSPSFSRADIALKYANGELSHEQLVREARRRNTTLVDLLTA